MLTFGIFLLLMMFCFFTNKDKEFTFSIEKTELLKAVLPFFILLGHCSLTYAVFSDFAKTGAFVVSLFFFMSGYGLEKKRLNSAVDIYYILNRVKSILIPIVIPASIYLSIYLLSHQNGVLTGICSVFKSWNIVLPFTWFLTKLIAIYVLYYFSSLSKRYFGVIFILLILAFDLVCILLKAPGHTYLSDFGFIFGVWYCKGANWIKNYKLSMASISVLLYLLLYPFLENGKVLLMEICIFTIACVVLLSSLPITFTKHPLVKFFKNISYEVYLCQGISFLVVSLLPMDNKWVNISVVFLLTYFLAYICKKICKYLFL